jgi:hypothetical protein
MPTLLKRYKSADKTQKGPIIKAIIEATGLSYPSVLRKINRENFSFSEQQVIAAKLQLDIEELFPTTNKN